jgi:hypothetical protein
METWQSSETSGTAFPTINRHNSERFTIIAVIASKSGIDTLFGLLDLTDGGNMLLRNVGNYHPTMHNIPHVWQFQRRTNSVVEWTTKWMNTWKQVLGPAWQRQRFPRKGFRPLSFLLYNPGHKKQHVVLSNVRHAPGRLCESLQVHLPRCGLSEHAPQMNRS